MLVHGPCASCCYWCVNLAASLWAMWAGCQGKAGLYPSPDTETCRQEGQVEALQWWWQIPECSRSVLECSAMEGRWYEASAFLTVVHTWCFQAPPPPICTLLTFTTLAVLTGNDSSTCFLSSPNTSVFGQPELHSVFYATTLGNSLIYPGRSRPAVRRRGLHWLTRVTPFRDRKGTD